MKPSFFKNLGPIHLNTIKGNVECDVFSIANDTHFNEFTALDKLKENGLSFITDREYSDKIDYNIGTLICSYSTSKKIKGSSQLIITKDVQKTVAILSNIFYRTFTRNEINKLDKPLIKSDCEIANNVVIENGSIIGKNTKIGSGSYIGYNCIIGDDVFIDRNTVITNSIIAENVCIGRNSSLGQEGFGFAIDRKKNIKIFHSGRVILQKGVNIGSNCTIDRGSFRDTIIGENTYFDNLCHVAHNVIVGNNCIFAAMTGIAGSTTVGNNVMAGGQTGINGHLKIGNNVMIAAQSGVVSNIKDNSSVMGHPAINKFTYIRKYKKNYA